MFRKEQKQITSVWIFKEFLLRRPAVIVTRVPNQLVIVLVVLFFDGVGLAHAEFALFHEPLDLFLVLSL